MPKPTESPPASCAPRFVASIRPGPPPVTTARPSEASPLPSWSARSYQGSSVGRRAEPNTVTAGRSIRSITSKPARSSSRMKSSDCSRSSSLRIQRACSALSVSCASMLVRRTLREELVHGAQVFLEEPRLRNLAAAHVHDVGMAVLELLAVPLAAKRSDDHGALVVRDAVVDLQGEVPAGRLGEPPERPHDLVDPAEVARELIPPWRVPDDLLGEGVVAERL